MNGNISETATGGVLLKKPFLKDFQYSQENVCVGVSFLTKLQALKECYFIKKRDSNTSDFL